MTCIVPQNRRICWSNEYVHVLVISPLLALMLADGNSLVAQVVPPVLLESSRAVLRSTFSHIMQKVCVHLYCLHLFEQVKPCHARDDKNVRFSSWYTCLQLFV